MRVAVISEPGRLDVREQPRPEPGQGELLIEVAFCGICGTDLHAIHAGLLPIGSVLGHECTGVVTEAGEGTEHRIGQRVVIRPSFICGQCPYCRRGDFRLCPDHFRKTVGVGAPGAFADAVVVKDYMAIPLPDGVPLDRAALVEPLACGVLSTRIAELERSDRVVVLGAGPIGLMVLACARQAGVAEIVVFERSPERRRLALELGADLALQMEEADAAPAWIADDGADVAFECAGAQTTLDAATTMTRSGGRIVVVALFDRPMSIDLPSIVPKGITISGAIGSRAEDFQRAIDLIAAGAVPADRLISDVLPLERIADAFARLRRPDGAVKILIAPNGATPTGS